VYPVCLEISDKLCIVVGGGTVALRKVKGLLAADGKVRVISPRLVEGLARLHEEKRIEWLARGFVSGDLEGAFLVFAATDRPEVQRLVVHEAGNAGIPVNVIDAPEQCDFQVPASLRRGKLTLAVSTDGTSPAVAAMIRNQLQGRYGEEYGVLLELMAKVREYLMVRESDCEHRKILFQNVLHDDIVLWIKTGQQERLRGHLRDVLGPDIDFDFTLPGVDA